MGIHLRAQTIMILAAAGMTACAAPGPVPPEQPDPALIAISRSIADIQATWAKLGAIEAARSPAYQRYADAFGNTLPPGWDRTITLEWSGPIEPLVRYLTRQAGYGFEVMGTKPANDVNVTLIAERPTPLGFLLRDAGFQAGSRAGVILGDDLVSLVYPD